MCVYSMIAEHYRTRPVEDWDVYKWMDYQDLVRKAKLWDEHNNQKDCEAAQKIEWEKAIEKVLRDKGLL